MKPVNIAKDKARKTSYKSPNGKTSRDKEAAPVIEVEKVHPVESNSDVIARCTPEDDKPVISTSAEDKLETKRVNPTSCTIEVSNATDGSKDAPTDSETSVCSGSKQAEVLSISQKESTESDVEITSESTPNSHHEEQEESASKDVQEPPEVKIKTLMFNFYYGILHLIFFFHLGHMYWIF